MCVWYTLAWKLRVAMSEGTGDSRSFGVEGRETGWSISRQEPESIRTRYQSR